MQRFILYLSISGRKKARYAKESPFYKMEMWVVPRIVCSSLAVVWQQGIFLCRLQSMQVCAKLCKWRRGCAKRILFCAENSVITGKQGKEEENESQIRPNQRTGSGTD